VVEILLLRALLALQLVALFGYAKLMSMKFVSAVLAALLLWAMAGSAQPSAFTYQGRLNNGANPASGAYDFQFQLYNAASNVVAGPLTNTPVTVSNGLFTVALDFGSAVFDGSALTLEIGVRTNGSTNAYSLLAPRQPVLSVPYAVQSLNAANAVNLAAPLQGTNITGTVPDARLSTNVALLNGSQTFGGANKFTGTLTATNPANIFTGIVSGNGIGQTNLSTTNLVGTLPDARLSTNVALLNGNQTFGGSNTFNGAVTAGNAANAYTGAFAGSGHGLTNVPGAFFWVTVPGTYLQANSNTGYIATNNVTPVTIVLPLAPSIGDVYKVAGVGAAGWIIAQTNNQTIIAGNLSSTAGQSWTANGPPAYWSAVGSSASGSTLVAAINGGQIYNSTNAGVTWTARDNARLWSHVASSADGTMWVATVGSGTGTPQSGYIYTSANSGASWTQRGTSLPWVACASSADGTKLVAAAYNDQIYTSVNSGQNWTGRTSGLGNLYWSSVASSADGTKLVAVVNGGQIYTSTNSGGTWTVRDSSRNWSSVASSSDGTRLVAAVSSGEIYISTDSGATWVGSTPLLDESWTSVASSADGSHLAAVYGIPPAMGYVYTSSDSGATWTQGVGAPNTSWAGIASSADGSQIVAVTSGTYIYLSSNASTTSGTAGYLSGAQHTAIELEYVGNGIFLPLSHEGTIRAY
jgi:hypothetical protein